MQTKDEIEKRLAEFTARQNWMHNIPLPHGLFTAGTSTRALGVFDNQDERLQKIQKLQRSGSKEGLLFELSLRGKRVLDVACGEGKYSFILAPDVGSVLGIDIDDIRIEKANYLNSVLGCPNVEFRTLNLYHKEFQALGSFDLSLCFGLLHRLPDPFSLVNSLAVQSNAILFEWITAPGMMSQNVPWAFHNQGGFYEWQNATYNYEPREIASKGRGGGGVNRASYWYMSYGALETMCMRAGLKYFIRFSRSAQYPDLSEDLENLSTRVMLLASKTPYTVFGRSSREGLKKWPRLKRKAESRDNK